MEIQLEEEMKTYEILIAGKWERVKGKTQGLREVTKKEKKD